MDLMAASYAIGKEGKCILINRLRGCKMDIWRGAKQNRQEQKCMLFMSIHDSLPKVIKSLIHDKRNESKGKETKI